MFVAEACLLGIIAAAIGASLGVGGILLVNMLKIPVTNEGVRLFLMTNTLKFSVHSTQFLSTLVLFAAVTGFASLYPALKAAGLRPVEALMSGK
jgi:putative ABC transport system permease protein